MCTTYPDRPQHRKLNTKTSESNNYKHLVYVALLLVFVWRTLTIL